jgi:hypothetical protein
VNTKPNGISWLEHKTLMLQQTNDGYLEPVALIGHDGFGAADKAAILER